MLPPTPPPKARELDDQIAALQAALGRLGTAGHDLADLAEIAQRFQLLRRQYVAHREQMDGHVPRLAQLRQRLEALLNAQLTRVVDRFHELGEQIRRAEAEHDFLREFFIRRAGTAGLELPGLRAQVTVKTQPNLAVPAAGTPERTRLNRLLQDSGRWADVSQLARARLLKALDANQFAPPQEQEILRLCPRTTTHTVVSRPRGDSSSS
jgi:hypothetical protein